MWRDPRIDPRPGDVTMHVGDYPTVFVVTKRDVDMVWFSQIAMKTGRAYENEPLAVERWAMESKNEEVLHAAKALREDLADMNLPEFASRGKVAQLRREAEANG